MVCYNINDDVNFTLTDYGETVLRTSYRSSVHPRNATRTYEMSIWEMMQIFGEKMFMGNQQIFVGNKVHIRGDFDRVFGDLNECYSTGMKRIDTSGCCGGGCKT